MFISNFLDINMS